MADYIHHVTLNSGHDRLSYRHEVADDIMPIMQDLLARMLAGGRVPLPVMDGYSLSGAAEGRCLTATVWSDGEVPLVTIGVAGEPECGAELWRGLHESTDQPLTTDPAAQSPVPWCAARLEAPAILHPGALTWLGDFERCLAWAWLERQ
jgi:hypothetical protein